MKKIVKGEEPSLLERYRTVSPNNDWTHCQQSKSRKRQIQEHLRSDQGNLCAYCEVDLLRTPGVTNNADCDVRDDFRVEHFHPKSDTSTGHNWSLDWQNLLACCHGGSYRGVADAANRFTAPDTSCDVPKGDKNLDGLILNPLTDIPAFPPLFTFVRSTGEIKVHKENCTSANVAIEKAQRTIDELHLDADRLKTLRRATLNALHSQMGNKLAAKMSIDDALASLAKATLRKNAQGEWPQFFSSIRSYLGSAAETHLRNIGYDG